MCFPHGLNLGASSSRWQRPGLSQQQVTRGWCAWTGSSERMDGHWGRCLASSLLKGVHVKGQGPQPPPAASPRLRVPDGPASGGLLAGATAEVLRRGQGRDNPLPHLPQWTWLRSRPNATLKREDRASFCPRPWGLTACARLAAGRGAVAASGTGGWAEATGGVTADWWPVWR